MPIVIIVNFIMAGIVVAWLIMHIVLSIAVWKDAARLLMARRGLFLIGPFMWFVVTLLTGLFGFIAYWLIHHSTLRPTPQD